MSLEDGSCESETFAGNEPKGMLQFYGLLTLEVVLCAPVVIGSGVLFDPQDLPAANWVHPVFALVGSLFSPVVAGLSFLNNRLALLQKLILLAVSFTGIVFLVLWLMGLPARLKF